MLVHLHPPTVTVYITVPPLPPAPSSPLVTRHILPSAEWFIFHLIWTLESGVKSPESLLPVPSENSISLAADVSTGLQPFSGIVNLYCRSQLGLSAGWLMPPIRFFVSGHQRFIFWCSMCSYLVWCGGRQGVHSWKVLPLESMIR